MGLVGVSVKQKLIQNVPRCNQTTRSLIQLHRRDPSNWLTYQHLNFLKRQYVAKSNNELHQRAIPKQAPVLTIVDERDDSVERQVQRIPTIDPAATDADPQPDDVTSKAQPEISTLKAATEDAVLPKKSMSSTVANSDEAPHVQVETDEAREARLDRQWKQLKVDVADLPDVYARLAKIKLTALVVTTAAAGYAMAPVPFDPVIFFVSCLGTGLSSCTANSINQRPETEPCSNSSVYLYLTLSRPSLSASYGQVWFQAYSEGEARAKNTILANVGRKKVLVGLVSRTPGPTLGTASAGVPAVITFQSGHYFS
eukprot:superscaffoldBa00000246_g3116